MKTPLALLSAILALTIAKAELVTINNSTNRDYSVVPTEILLRHRDDIQPIIDKQKAKLSQRATYPIWARYDLEKSIKHLEAVKAQATNSPLPFSLKDEIDMIEAVKFADIVRTNSPGALKKGVRKAGAFVRATEPDDISNAITAGVKAKAALKSKKPDDLKAFQDSQPKK